MVLALPELLFPARAAPEAAPDVLLLWEAGLCPDPRALTQLHREQG